MARRGARSARTGTTVARVYERVPFYKRRMDAAGVKPSDVRTLDDIRLLPFTTKDDMREGYPFGLFAVPLHDVVRIHSSSGTTGKPVVAGYTRADIDLWANLMARTFVCGEVTARDVLQAGDSGAHPQHLGLHRPRQERLVSFVRAELDPQLASG